MKELKLAVFCGPTISAAAVSELLPSAIVQPPAECGDVYRICRDTSVAAIGLIDGYFEHRLSVWHKELLWALDRGIHVYGSSSMGALRAAELAAYGMVGVGKIFEQFCTRELEDDDEVAVVHEAAERGYALRSEAMVNLREALGQAVVAGVIGETDRDLLIAALKQLFYPQRTRQALSRFAKELLASATSRGLIDWIESRGIVDQKRADAVEMLLRMSTDARAGTLGEPPERRAPFEYTSAWHALREAVEREARETANVSSLPAHGVVGLSAEGNAASASGPYRGTAPAEVSALLGHLHLELGEAFPAMLSDAVERAFALVLAELEGRIVDAPTVQAESERFRQERGLLSPEQTASWLAQYNMSVSAFSALIYNNALCDAFAEKVRQAALQQLPSVLANRGVVRPRWPIAGYSPSHG